MGYSFSTCRWKNKTTKVKGFNFSTGERRAELRSGIRSLRKPSSPTGVNEEAQSHQMSQRTVKEVLSPSTGAVSSPDTSPQQQQEQQQPADDATGGMQLHQIVTMQWYFVDNTKSMQGPMSVAALAKNWRSGAVTENTYVWTQGLENWKKVCSS